MTPEYDALVLAYLREGFAATHQRVRRLKGKLDTYDRVMTSLLEIPCLMHSLFDLMEPEAQGYTVCHPLGAPGVTKMSRYIVATPHLVALIEQCFRRVNPERYDLKIEEYIACYPVPDGHSEWVLWSRHFYFKHKLRVLSDVLST